MKQRYVLWLITQLLIGNDGIALTMESISIDSTHPYYVDGIVITSQNNSNSIVGLNKGESTRFYDSNKGAEWTTPYGDGTAGDSLMCWAHAASNSIQYWQSYYGVFYQGERELPYGKIGTEPVSYGSTETTGNARQLAVAKAFYENWPNHGGKFGPATEWYFKWDDTKSNGGYYTEYFGDSTSSQNSYVTIYSQRGENIGGGGNIDTSIGYTPFEDTRAGFTQALMPAFGLTQQETGKYQKTQVGLLPFIGIWYDTTSEEEGTLSYGHMISCYGFTLDSNGCVDAIFVSNSDDETSQLQKIYIKEEEGKLNLYRNAQGTQLFYNRNWYIGEISYINTPDILQSMYETYTSSSVPLVWNGGVMGIWQAQQSSTEKLPDLSTGWDVEIEHAEGQPSSYFHSYAETGRKVRFDSHGNGGTVTIVGIVSPGEIEIAEAHYHFAAGKDATLAGEGDIHIRQKAKLSSDANIGLRTIHLAQQAEFSYERQTDTNLGKIHSESGAKLYFVNKSTNGTTTYTVADMSASFGELHIGATDDLYATHLVTTGNVQAQSLILAGDSTISTDGVVTITEDLVCLEAIRVRSTFSLSDTGQSPAINADTDLSNTHTLSMGQAIAFNGHKLLLSRSNAITLTLPHVLNQGDQFILFEGISELGIDNSIVSTTTLFQADNFFTGVYINHNMQLLYTQAEHGNGSLALVHLIPEPLSSTLSIISLMSLTLRRRR